MDGGGTYISLFNTDYEVTLISVLHTYILVVLQALEEKLKPLNWERNEVIAFPFLFKKSCLPCCSKYKVCVELSEKESAGPGWTANVVGANTVSVNVAVQCLHFTQYTVLFYACANSYTSFLD